MDDRDHYQTLGVSPDAEEVVITAAYRALAQRYHPDKWGGDAKYAHQRMAEINEAYRILRDPELRAGYDRARAAPGQRQSFQEQEEDAENARAFDQALASLESKWSVAVGVYPDLGQLRDSLAKISRQLAFQFVVVMLEKRLFEDRQRIAQSLEREFLERYFGTDPKVLSFGRTLIFAGQRDAALALNRLVSVVGSEIPAERVIAKIKQDFKIATPQPAAGTERAASRTASGRTGPAQRMDGSPVTTGIVIAGVMVIAVTMLWAKIPRSPAASSQPVAEAPRVEAPRVEAQRANEPRFDRCKGNPEQQKCEELELKLAQETPAERAARRALTESQARRATTQAQSGEYQFVPSPSTPSAPAPDPEQQATTGYVRGEPKGAQGGLSSFTVDNGTGSGDALVRLYRNGAKPAVRTFFIRKGDRFSASSLAPGEYVLRYRYMGSDATFEADRSFAVREEHTEQGTRYSRVVVTLYSVADGNLKTKIVFKEAF